MSPGLAARVRALARMDLCLASSGENGKPAMVTLADGKEIPFQGGDAIRHLMSRLLEGHVEETGGGRATPGVGLLTGVAPWRAL